MDAYDKTIEFLKDHQGDAIKIGIHAYNLCTYSTFYNWALSYDDYEIIISDDNHEITIISGGDTEIIGYTTNNMEMSVFRESGDFELHTQYGSICFELE